MLSSVNKGDIKFTMSLVALRISAEGSVVKDLVMTEKAAISLVGLNAALNMIR